MEEPAGLAEWCAEHLGAPPVETLSRAVHLSVVTGVRLADGREVVVKARPPAERLAGCVAVQRHLFEAGFPCPEPLAGPAPLGPIVAATAEAYVPGGELLDRAGGARFAAALHHLHQLAPPPTAEPSLDPAPPWVRWDHDRPGRWPEADDSDVDLNSVPDPAWLAAAVDQACATLAAADLPAIVGHADWESQNLRWTGERLHVVHDWDSVAARPEAVLVGTAAAVFPADGRPGVAATVAESEAFLAAYEAARGRPFADDERRACWAAGVWVRAFNAKKALVANPADPAIQRFRAEVGHRLAFFGK